MLQYANSESGGESLTTPAPARYAVLSGPQHFDLHPQSAPVCKPAEVLIRLDGCGICASSLPLWQGRPWFTYPLEPGTPGHEGWGTVAGIGRDVRMDDLSPGQKVTCLNTTAFAGYIAVSADQVVPLPEFLHDQPFPGEAVGCAMNIFRRADIGGEHCVAVIGAGFLGLLLVQLAVDAGARVLVLSRRRSVRELAFRYGAAAAFGTENWQDSAQEIMKLTGGRGCHRVVEATGLQFALDLATEIIGEYGRLVIAGYHQDGMRQVDMQKWNWRGLDVVNAHERDSGLYVRGIIEGIEAVRQGRINLAPLLTHQFTLDQLNEAFQMMVDRPDGFVKGWVSL